MKVCFPVEKNEGITSAVFGHFGSAPSFVVVDVESGDVGELVNNDLGHSHGNCSPIKALGGAEIGAVVVGGIGGGALGGLTRAGIRVYRSEGGTVEENLAKFKSGTLNRYLPGDTCAGHGEGHDCGHHG
ncbi:MAG: diguanylate cyclase [Deltaproteobacteria bacterium]|nr:MAG: diguanylate cyclase [Deltaproteobacteria bacterium]